MTFMDWLIEANAKAKEEWAKDAADFNVREACASRSFQCPDCGTVNNSPAFGYLGITRMSATPVVFCGGCPLMVSESVLEHFLL